MSYVLAQKLQSSDTADGGESEPIATDDADLRFRERFYALSPDSLEVTDAETAEKAASEGGEGLGILLAEFPQDDISVYGYVDAEKPWQGVMIRCGDNVSYFPDIVYLSESREMPEIYPLRLLKKPGGNHDMSGIYGRGLSGADGKPFFPELPAWGKQRETGGPGWEADW